MRALWVEDHVLIADSLETLLLVVMPELSLDKARDLDTAIGLVRAIPYDLVLLDWWLGAHTGEHFIGKLVEVGCRAPLLVVSGDDRELVKQRALALGAVGFVSKASKPAELVDTIRAVLGNAQRLGRERAPTPAEAPLPRPNAGVGRIFPELTDRQVEVFEELMLGLSDKQIARKLGVATTTVRTHVRAILEVVGVHSRGEAAHAAWLRGSGAL